VTADILSRIDSALAGDGTVNYGETGDSMRWQPGLVICDEGGPLSPIPAKVPQGLEWDDDDSAGPDDDTWGPFTVRLHFRVPHEGWNACVKAEARSADRMPEMARSMTRAYATMRGWYPRPASHCDECNPKGNPEPLAVNGHEYRRRQMNRRKRGR
jgi:hypothetical protein